MTPEQLAKQLKQALPGGLRSVVLYGSAAAGDHIPGKSDFNILVVADPLGLAELNALAAPAVAWAKAGNRPPLLFTPQQLAASGDAFPIELLDMQQSRKVLFGDDPLRSVSINPAHLRVQLEREWKAKLLQLRERYLLTRGKPAPVLDLLTASLSAVLVLCRATLRLYQSDVPSQKLDALRVLAQRINFDPQVFLTIHELKAGRRKSRDVAAIGVFETYLKTVEQIAEAVDRYGPQPTGGN
jgi:hypothetical protein